MGAVMDSTLMHINKGKTGEDTNRVNFQHSRLLLADFCLD